MKHYFIINPIAGEKNSTELIEQMLRELLKEDEYIIHITNGKNDATIYIQEVCQHNQQLANPQKITFYICGGDGTCNEAVNGLAGYRDARFTIIPIGSCNDFLKNYPGADFMNLENLINGEEIAIDLIKVNERYCLNVANIGFDAKVNNDCVIHRQRYKSVKQSYNAAIVRNILKPLGDEVTISADGEKIFTGKMLLTAVANGGFYGGGYNCAPYAMCNDGKLDLIVVKKVSRIKFARLIKYYKNGEHLDLEQFSKIVKFKQATVINIHGDTPLAVCLDGENYLLKDLNIEVIKDGLNFVIPWGYNYEKRK